MTDSIFAEHALLPEGWARDVRISFDEGGAITSVEAESQPSGPRLKAVLPTLSNLHSHAFQRAMAGLAEVAGPRNDSFWTWRDVMYRCVAQMTPEDVQTVATKLQIELLKGGFGHLVEFHYQHHDGAGRPYANPAETSLRQFAAASETGVGMTLLPVFYAHAGFGGQPAVPGQRPFLHDVDGFLSLMQQVRAAAPAGQSVGYAIHSLRAATPDEIRAIIAAQPANTPTHIHVSEQMLEVEGCIAWSGKRPVEWLLDEIGLDRNWCLIHATHMTEDETRRLAQSGAVAGLCPMTEANLGDGIFPATEFARHGGSYGIGTDSHVSVSVAEELRMLEYSQRLRDRSRNAMAGGEGRSTGRSLFEAAYKGGHQAAGIAAQGIAVGAPASWVALDSDNPFIAEAAGDTLIDRWIFTLGDAAIRDVWVRGRRVIENRRHALDGEIDARFADVLKKISA